jgi:hypothetical protein
MEEVSPYLTITKTKQKGGEFLGKVIEEAATGGNNH